MKKFQIISGSTLKIFAIIFMTIDHIGYFLLPSYSSAYTILRSIGRLALPLFIFMTVEGVYHTRNALKYFARLFVIGVIIDVVLAIFEKNMIGNIMMDLSLYVLIIYLLRKKNWYSLLALPIMAFFVLSDFDFAYNGYTLINTEYGTFGLLMALLFASGKWISNQIVTYQANKLQVDLEYFKEEHLQTVYNSICIAFLFFMSALIYFIYRIDYTFVLLPNFVTTQTWCFMAFPFMLLYNGKRGYNKPWFKYGAYLYYPIHVLIIYGISTLI